MTDTTEQQLPINAFAGIFLAATGLGVLIISGDLLRSALFFGVGLFFLMRALAQYNHAPADDPTGEPTDDPTGEPTDDPTNGTD